MCDFGYFRVMDGKQQQQQQRKIEDHVVQVDCFKEDTYELPNDKARHCESDFYSSHNFFMI